MRTWATLRFRDQSNNTDRELVLRSKDEAAQVIVAIAGLLGGEVGGCFTSSGDFEISCEPPKRKK